MIMVVIDYGAISTTDVNTILSMLGLSNDSTEVCFLEHLVDNGNTVIHAECERCVFITGLDGGVKRYHKEFVRENKHIMSWIFSVVSVETELYKEQYRKQIDNLFNSFELFYAVEFDEENSFERTKDVLKRPIKTRRILSVVSKNEELSKKVCKIFEQYLPDWTVVIADGEGKDLCDADAVVIAGKEGCDFDVKAPEKNLRHKYVWVNEKWGESDEDFLCEIDCTLEKNNWDIYNLEKKIMCSNLTYEQFLCQIKQGELEYISLRNNEDFVVADDYGLPILPDEYAEDAIAGFIEKTCVFQKIAESVKINC